MVPCPEIEKKHAQKSAVPPIFNFAILRTSKPAVHFEFSNTGPLRRNQKEKVSCFETTRTRENPAAQTFLSGAAFPQRRDVKFSHAPLFLLCHQLANSQTAPSARLSPPPFHRRNLKVCTFGYSFPFITSSFTHPGPVSFFLCCIFF